MSDAESDLMRRAGADEPGAFERLVGLVLPRLLGFFRRLGADHAFAEDCAQDVLLKLYRVRSTYVPRARFVTYLLHVARNHWIDIYRHRKLGPAMVSADSGGGEDDEAPSLATLARAAPETPGAGLDRRHLTAALDRALATLRPEHREVFVLAQVETLRYEEISVLLGIPVGTVKSRVHTAMRTLRESLEREGIEP